MRPALINVVCRTAMPSSILIIDASAEFYRSRLSGIFPSVALRAVSERRAVTADQLADAEAIFGHGTAHVFDEELLGGAKRLKWIQSLTTGTDGIVSLASLRPEVVITTNTGIHGPQMSEMAFMHMLNLARQAPRMWENQKEERWERWTQIRLCGKTAVILGVGSIAESLAPRCKAFGMTVLGVSGTPRQLPGFDRIHPRSELMQVVPQADFLVILLPLKPENVKLVDAKVFAAMKQGSYLINIGRGAVCDEEALLEALRTRHLAGAGLDVFSTTPLPPGHPLWHTPNVLISAQMAGGSEVNRLLNLPILERNLRCFLEGRWSDMINRVAR
jgi:D-2-hydroxyacid dehydrogenase (NADP+)